MIKGLDKKLSEVLKDYLDSSKIDGEPAIQHEFIERIKSIFEYKELGPLKERQETFLKSLAEYTSKYDQASLLKFAKYWMEKGPRSDEMRFEKQKTWSLSGRLATWNQIGKKNSISRMVAGSAAKIDKFINR